MKLEQRQLEEKIGASLLIVVEGLKRQVGGKWPFTLYQKTTATPL